MSALEAALLGIVQGVTEFLPISSSAHLILARDLFGWNLEDDFALAFDVACHVGTLAAVAAFFRADVRALAAAALRPAAWRTAGDPEARLLRAVAIATVPVVVVGVAAGDWITSTLRTPEVAAVSLAGGALAMLAAERIGRRPRTPQRASAPHPGPRRADDARADDAAPDDARPDDAPGWAGSLVLGAAQAAALAPGVSRSGAVLVAAMLGGMRRARAARFAFLLGIPAIAGAGAKGMLDVAGGGVPPGGPTALAVGAVASGLVGYVAIAGFVRYVARHTLAPFAYYRIGLAAAVLLAR